MKKLIIFNLLLLIPLLILNFGCVQENEYNLPGKTKSEIMQMSRKAALGLGFRIVYDDEQMGIIQAIKETKGGTTGFIHEGTGFLGSKPSGVQEMITLTIEDEQIIVRVETAGDTIYDQQGAENIKKDFLRRIGIKAKEPTGFY